MDNEKKMITSQERIDSSKRLCDKRIDICQEIHKIETSKIQLETIEQSVEQAIEQSKRVTSEFAIYVDGDPNNILLHTDITRECLDAILAWYGDYLDDLYDALSNPDDYSKFNCRYIHNKYLDK